MLFCHISPSPHQTRALASRSRPTQESFGTTIARLRRTEGLSFCLRGMQRNLVAVAAPIGMTIFLTEALTEALKGE